MKKDIEDLKILLASGEPARLFPVLSEGGREGRATSVLLSTMMAVPPLARALMQLCDAPATSQSRLVCFTEPKFLPSVVGVENSAHRPDGLIRVIRGNTVWTALVEVKTGRDRLDGTQVLNYMSLAKTLGFQAVVTISNQITSSTRASPLQIDKRRLGSISLYHLPWSAILTEAIVLADHSGLDDADQQFVLEEFRRYLLHDKSGIIEFDQMPTAWKALCDAVKSHIAIPPGSSDETTVVQAWQECSQALALHLVMHLGKGVTVSLNRAQKNDPQRLAGDMSEEFRRQKSFSVSLSIPNASSEMLIIAQLSTRTVSLQMSVQPPRDRKYSFACTTWLLTQLSSFQGGDLVIEASYSYKPPVTASLEAARKDKNALSLPGDTTTLPTKLTVRRNVDLGARFTSAKQFVSSLREQAVDFYGAIGQNLYSWSEPAPKVRDVSVAVAEPTVTSRETSVQDSDAQNAQESAPSRDRDTVDTGSPPSEPLV